MGIIGGRKHRLSLELRLSLIDMKEQEKLDMYELPEMEVKGREVIHFEYDLFLDGIKFNLETMY